MPVLERLHSPWHVLVGAVILALALHLAGARLPRAAGAAGRFLGRAFAVLVMLAVGVAGLEAATGMSVGDLAAGAVDRVRTAWLILRGEVQP